MANSIEIKHERYELACQELARIFNQKNVWREDNTTYGDYRFLNGHIEERNKQYVVIVSSNYWAQSTLDALKEKGHIDLY